MLELKKRQLNNLEDINIITYVQLFTTESSTRFSILMSPAI